MFKLFDAHSHINFPDFDNDGNEVIKRTLDERMGTIIVGTCADDSLKAIKISGPYSSGVYASVGLHPTNIGHEDFEVNHYCELAKNPKVVAVGECGLDFFRIKDEESRIKQKEIFKKQVALALELDKPLIIHCRQAHDDVLDILKSYRSPTLRGDIHFFSGNWEQAQKYFDLGFFISFTGVITFPPLRRAGTGDYDEIIEKVPLEKIIVETDSPFVAPVPYRGRRNEPIYVVEVAKKIAEIKGVPYEKVAKITTENAVKLFGIML